MAKEIDMLEARVQQPLGGINDANRKEGFWGSSITPEAFDAEWPERERFLRALGILERHSQQERFRGWSNCRVCGCMNGSDTYHAKGWQWPSGFSHYVRDHELKPTDAFIAMVFEFAPVE